jgi:hypothetical protein
MSLTSGQLACARAAECQTDGRPIFGRDVRQATQETGPTRWTGQFAADDSIKGQFQGILPDMVILPTNLPALISADQRGHHPSSAPEMTPNGSAPKYAESPSRSSITWFRRTDCGTSMRPKHVAK